MTPAELRELATMLGDDKPITSENLDRAADYLRACADALDAGPVAWLDDFGNAFPIGAYNGAGSWRDDDKREWKRLYPVALPGALRMPEPMTDADVFAEMDRYEVEGYDLARAIEAETLRRVKEANE